MLNTNQKENIRSILLSKNITIFSRYFIFIFMYLVIYKKIIVISSGCMGVQVVSAKRVNRNNEITVWLYVSFHLAEKLM